MWHLKIKTRKGKVIDGGDQFATPGMALIHAYELAPMDKLAVITIEHIDANKIAAAQEHYKDLMRELLLQ